jgi:hypothetical protein
MIFPICSVLSYSRAGTGLSDMQCTVISKGLDVEYVISDMQCSV